MTKHIEEKHISVLYHELLEAIVIFNNTQNTIIDATLGMWGHAKWIIKKMNPGDIFVGFDADERNLIQARERLKDIWNEVKKIFILSNFENLQAELQKHGIETITWIYYDLWVSSLHFDEAERGFSFQHDGPLDMRFDTSSGKPASFVLNQYRKDQLIEIFQNYWEEPMTKKIAQAIVDQRRIKKFETTFEHNELIKQTSNIPKSNTRVFQALRIEVNKELEVLKSSLLQAVNVLQKKGNLFVISFHSLEDRIVKQYMKQETRDCICTEMICRCWHVKKLRIVTKKPILPTSEEISLNQRARSAKARHAVKL